MPDMNLAAFNDNSSSHAERVGLKSYSNLLKFTVIGMAGFFAFAVVVGLYVSISPLTALSAIVLVPAGLYYKLRKDKQKLKVLTERLAADNNWTVNQPTPADAYQAGPAVNLPIGKTGQLAGSLNGLPFWLCVDDPDTYLLIDAKKKLPRAIFITSVYNSGPTKFFFDQFLKAEGLAPVKLEGDFNKYFTLYTEPATNINALSIIAPDFMASLIDSGLVSSVMFTNHFCIIKPQQNNQKNLRALLVSGQAVTKELSD